MRRSSAIEPGKRPERAFFRFTPCLGVRVVRALKTPMLIDDRNNQNTLYLGSAVMANHYR
jgi:hypothetical protein